MVNSLHTSRCREIFYSHQKLWKENNKNFALQKVSNNEIDNIILTTYKRLTDKYKLDKLLILKKNIYELNYSALKDNPMMVLPNIYINLNLGNYKNAYPYFQAYFSTLHYQPFKYEYDPALCKKLDLIL